MDRLICLQAKYIHHTVENSVNGIVNFSYPAVYMGHEVEGVTLWVKNGLIEKWEAKRGQAFLNKVFKMKGARNFGEAAIGTNYNINKFTKNILFDEKIGRQPFTWQLDNLIVNVEVKTFPPFIGT